MVDDVKNITETAESKGIVFFNYTSVVLVFYVYENI